MLKALRSPAIKKTVSTQQENFENKPNDVVTVAFIINKWHIIQKQIFFSINYSLSEWILYSLGDISTPKPHLLNLTILNNLFIPKATC